MPDKKTLQRAQEDKREGKAPSTQAGEFARGNGAHTRGQARCPIGQAGHRDRSFQGAPGCCRAQGPRQGKGLRADSPPCRARQRRGRQRSEGAVAKALPRDAFSAQARRQQRGKHGGAFPADQGRGQKADCGGSVGSGAQGRTHPGPEQLSVRINTLRARSRLKTARAGCRAGDRRE